MISLNATQLAIVASATKRPAWLFEVNDGLASPTTYYWSMKDYTFSGQTYDARIMPESFDGITIRRAQSEMGIQAPNELTFKIANKGNLLTAASFGEDATVTVKLVVKAGASEEIIRSWKYFIRDVVPLYQVLEISCEDFLQHYLDGDYPNTPAIKDLFYGSDVAAVDDNVCVPVAVGTAYVPLGSVYISGVVTVSGTGISAVASSSGARCKFQVPGAGFASIEVGRYIFTSGFANAANNGTFAVLARTASEIQVAITAGLVDEAAGPTVTVTQGSRYYILGPSTKTFTVDRVRSPRECGLKSEWTAAEGFAFTQSIQTDVMGNAWKAMQPIIADVDKDGTADAPGFWRNGDQFLDMPAKFSDSATFALTSPADWIDHVLRDFGLAAGDLDAAMFAAAKAVYSARGLTFNGAYWYHQRREKVLADLLVMCHSTLTFGTQIGLRPLSKASVKTITKADVLRRQAKGPGTFSYKPARTRKQADCGHVTWQPAGEAQDKFLNILVPVKSARSKVASDSIEVPFVQDSQDVQRIGTLYYQRKFPIQGEASFTGKGALLALEPDDVVTISHADYGGTYDVLIDSMKINRDLSIDFGLTRFSIALDDWTDLSPAAISVAAEDTTALWQPPLTGPLSEKDVGRASYDLWGKEYLPVAPETNKGDVTDIQEAMNKVAQAGGGAIILKNGVYQATDVLHVPDVNIDMAGETRDGVVLKNKAGSDLFRIFDRSKQYKFRDFTVESQNVAAPYSKMFYIYGTTAAQNTTDCTFDNVRLILGDSKTAGGAGDYGIVDVPGNSALLVARSIITGGRIQINANCQKLRVNYNTLTGANTEAISANATGTDIMEILANVIADIYYHGISALSANAMNISGNTLKAITTSAIKADWGGIFFGGDNSNVTENTVICVNNGVTGLFLGIAHNYSAQASKNCHVNQNTVNTAINNYTTGDAAAFLLLAVSDSEIEGNIAVIDVNAGGSMSAQNCRGISLSYNLTPAYSCRNVVRGNNVDMVDSKSNFTGIFLDASCNNNHGTDNILTNTGTGISDSGSGNSINMSGG